MADSKRIKRLRSEIIKIIPKFPNNKQTKNILESKTLTDLLTVYLNWATRLIVARPRKVEISTEITEDYRWVSVANIFEKLKDKIEKGEDLMPYLSLRAQEKGFTPDISNSNPGFDKWADKDFLLNVMGFYHFHLGDMQKNGKNITKRTDDVIFAKVDRKVVKVFGVFSHAVFDDTGQDSKEIKSEKIRLWNLFRKLVTEDVPQGSFVIPSMIAGSGYTLQVVRNAQIFVRIIEEFDSQLDNRAYVNSLYQGTGIEPPNKPKIDWCLRGTDLGVFDRTTNLFAVYCYGTN